MFNCAISTPSLTPRNNAITATNKQTREGISFKPLVFSFTDILYPNKQMAQKISDEIGLHGIIAVTLPAEEQLLLEQLRKTNEAVFSLPHETLKAYHFGNNRRTQTDTQLPTGETIPAGTRLPMAGYLHSETPMDQIKWKATIPTSTSGTANMGVVSYNEVYERVYTPKLFRGSPNALIPPNQNPSTSDIDFEQTWLGSMKLLESINNAVIGALAKANDWSNEVLEPMLAQPTKHHPTDSFRLAHLPTVAPNGLPNTSNDERIIRFDGHVDRSSITTALPAASLPGLQIAFSGEKLMRDIESPDITQKIVYVVSGHFLNKLTGGQYTGSLHRVVGTPEQMKKARYSEVYFKAPSSDAPWRLLNAPEEHLVLPTEDKMPIIEGRLWTAFKALPRPSLTTEKATLPFNSAWYDYLYPRAVKNRLDQIVAYKQKLVERFGS
ncbi:MAG: hypothetical protein H2174_10020 [Vampirovibrio sp.]|nr:hypothetical protein [Vampirovibrio sp.]